MLGIGNVLLRDEGVGVHAIDALRSAPPGESDLPPDTRLVDGGTLGLDLLPLFEGVRGAVLVDAACLGLAPGMVVVLRGEATGAAPGPAMSVHELGVAELVETARWMGSLPNSVRVVLIEPQDIGPGLSLSACVAAAMPHVLEVIRSAAWEVATR